MNNGNHFGEPEISKKDVLLYIFYSFIVDAALAVFLPMISGVDPNAISVMERLKAPSAEHWAGTDELGRDLAMRIVWGGRYSIMIGIATACFSVIAGTALGLLAGFFRRLDAPIMRVIDAMMSFPDILLGISLVSILGASLWNVVLALAIVWSTLATRQHVLLDVIAGFLLGLLFAFGSLRQLQRTQCRPLL